MAASSAPAYGVVTKACYFRTVIPSRPAQYVGSLPDSERTSCNCWQRAERPCRESVGDQLSHTVVVSAMAFSSAIGRLSVLSQHLSADSESGTLQRQETRADEDVRPAPGGGPGTLTVLDNRTGKKYTVSCLNSPQPLSYSAAGKVSAHVAAWAPSLLGQSFSVHPHPHLNEACRSMQLEVSEGGTINAQALKKITAGGDGVGLRTYDPG